MLFQTFWVKEEVLKMKILKFFHYVHCYILAKNSDSEFFSRFDFANFKPF